MRSITVAAFRFRSSLLAVAAAASLGAFLLGGSGVAEARERPSKPERPPISDELPRECRCDDVQVLKVEPLLTGGGSSSPNGTLRFRVKWAITCEAGREADCEGKIRIVPTPSGGEPGRDYYVETPEYSTISCQGQACAKSTVGTTTVNVTVVNPTERFEFRLARYCVDGQDDLLLGSWPLTIVVKDPSDLSKRFDFTKSDLNGDGKPDGKAKKVQR